MIDLKKTDNTDCKFKCGIADEGIIKSNKLKWGLVTMRHKHLSLDMKLKMLMLIFIMYNCNVSKQLWNMQLYNMQLSPWKFSCINHVI